MTLVEHYTADCSGTLIEESFEACVCEICSNGGCCGDGGILYYRCNRCGFQISCKGIWCNPETTQLLM